MLGCRLGEVLNCVHWQEGDAGCGTSRFCTACGALDAIATTLKQGGPEARDWRLTQRTPDGDAAMDLRVWSRQLHLEEPYVLLAISDISDEKRRQVLERMFFHDLLNLAGGLRGIMEVWPDLSPEEACSMSQVALRLLDWLVEEIEAGRDLALAECGELRPRLSVINVQHFLRRLSECYQHHPAAEGKRLDVAVTEGSASIDSDPVLLQRVLGNLIKNALEASHESQTVGVRFRDQEAAVFTVHNETTIPPNARLQIFQRSFSTKLGTGRGIGTYCAKLLTELFLRRRRAGTPGRRGALILGLALAGYSRLDSFAPDGLAADGRRAFFGASELYDVNAAPELRSFFDGQLGRYEVAPKRTCLSDLGPFRGPDFSFEMPQNRDDARYNISPYTSVWPDR
jgi:hypothetical protein